MIYKVRIMESAQKDMQEVYRYIAEDLLNPSAATHRIMDIEKAINSLKKMPRRFPLVVDDYLASKGLRMIVVKNHLVFFLVREEIKKVSVIRIIHLRRDWVRMLRINVDQIRN